MSDLPMITVTSLHDGFANAEQVPDNLPQYGKCPTCGSRGLSQSVDADLVLLCSPCLLLRGDRVETVPDGPCPFDAVLEWQDVAVDFPHGVFTSSVTKSVTALHHADECVDAITNENGTDYRFCHPDALPGQWHLTFREAGQ